MAGDIQTWWMDKDLEGSRHGLFQGTQGIHLNILREIIQIFFQDS
jgi:hypothetical protein